MRTEFLTSAALAAGLLLAAVAVGGGPAGAAAGTPYRDPRVTGVLTLCDAAGHAVTSGDVHAAPFVARAVGATSAPSLYAGTGRSATLYAYQPRPQVSPDQWSGELLTAATRYGRPAHPTAVATAGDYSLADFLDGYPTLQDGLVQLRLYLTAPQQPALTTGYDAVDLRVHGTRWTALEHGSASCHSGDAVSRETQLLPASALVPASAEPSAGSGPTSSRPAGTEAAGASGAVRTYATSAAPSPVAAASRPGHGTSVPLLAWLAGGAAVLLAGLLIRRRTRST